ncbi:MAG: hypothetical protein ACR2LI_09310 [Propionibacteriaceae bacterium]
MADLTLAQSLALAGGSAVFGFVASAVSSLLARKESRRREDGERVESRRKDRLAAYAAYLASATELDSRLDLYTPNAGQLGRAKGLDATAQMISQEAQAEGIDVGDVVLHRSTDLVGPDQHPGLKEALITTNGLAALVGVIGASPVPEAAQKLSTAQRTWLMALLRNDPASAAEALGVARPALRTFREAAQRGVS